MTLADFFRDHPRVAVAFSGGVDSAYLLYAARQAGAQVRAYYVQSVFQPQFERNDALRVAAELSVPLQMLPVDILACQTVADNPADRCYHCKRLIFETIREAAVADGFPTLLDGTNASDQVSDRPGMRALAELEVLSPLRLCGLTKDEIRRRSRAAGLFTWDKPAYACLATRIPTGTPITPQLLQATEAAEACLSALGLSDLRVRRQGDLAILQVPAGQMPLVLRHRETILAQLRRDYGKVLLDLEGRG